MQPNVNPKYFGDEPTIIHQNLKAQKTATITSDDFKRVQQQLGALQIGDDRRKYLEEKRALSNKSKERVKYWENTVHGQRRKRLLARDERLAEEEAKRVEQDLEYEQQVQNQRNTSINRARTLMYNELDHVKQFHSRLLTQHILKERDLQLEYKKQQREKGGQYYSHLLPMEDIFGYSAANNDKDAKNHENQIKCAEDQKLTWQRQQDLKKEALKRDLEEGKEILRKDMELYRAQKNARIEKKKTSQKQFLSQLIESKDEKNHLKQIQNAQDSQEDFVIKSWKRHKDHLMKKKKKIEEERFQEMLGIREAMGQRQAKIIQEAEIHNDKAIENAVKREILKKERIDKEKAAKLAKDLIETKKHREEQFKRKEEQEYNQKKEDKEWLQRYQSQAKAFEDENNRRKQKNREESLKLQQFHFDQIKNVKKMKDDEKNDTLRFHSDLVGKTKAEENRFSNYVKSISKELWTLDGKGADKIQKFLSHEVNNVHLEGHAQRKQGVPQLSVAQTSERLGFGTANTDSGFKEPLVGLLTSGSV